MSERTGFVRGNQTMHKLLAEIFSSARIPCTHPFQRIAFAGILYIITVKEVSYG